MGGDDQLPQHSSQSSTLPMMILGPLTTKGGVCTRMYTLACAHTSKESGTKRGGKGSGEADQRAEEGGTEEAAGVVMTRMRHCCVRGE